MREDRYSNDEAGAAYFNEGLGIDDRPTAADFAPDDVVDTSAHDVVCRAKVHNPMPDGSRAPRCYHCPRCGGDVKQPLLSETYVYCSRPTCSWTFGVASEPPF